MASMLGARWPSRLSSVCETVPFRYSKAAGILGNKNLQAMPLRYSKVAGILGNEHLLAGAVRVSLRGPSSKWQVASERKSDNGDGWILNNSAAVRSMPLIAGVVGVIAILLNHLVSGIAPIAVASSAQSRTDVLVLALSATVALTGLVWKSIEPKPQIPVVLEGINCIRVASGLSAKVSQELNWTWETFAGVSNAVSLVIVYGNTCVFQAGIAAEASEGGVCVPVDVGTLLQGTLYQTVHSSQKQMYLANLALYPGRFELPFLASNTQAVIIQPLGDDGVMIVGSDTIRGFDPSDQRWVVAFGEKLDSVLSNIALSGADEDAYIDATKSEESENSVGKLPS